MSRTAALALYCLPLSVEKLLAELDRRLRLYPSDTFVDVWVL